MNPKEFNSKVEQIKDKLLNGITEKEIISELKAEKATIYKIDKLVRTSKSGILKDKIDYCLELDTDGDRKQECIDYLKNSLDGEILESAVKELTQKQTRMVKKAVKRELSDSNRFHLIIDTYANDYVSKKEIKSWIEYHYRDLIFKQKKDKKNAIYAGISSAGLGILLTVGSYLIVSSSGGGKYVITYGLILFGLIAIAKASSIKVDEVPVIKLDED